MPRQNLRSLYVTSTARIGGAELRAFHLARYGADYGIEGSLLMLEKAGGLKDRADRENVRARAWDLRPWSFLASVSKLRSELVREKFDVVQPFGLRAEILTRSAASGLPCAVISSICSVDAWRRWHHVALDRSTSGVVKAWISNSEAGKQAAVLREKMNPEQVYVVPTGIPDRKSASEAWTNLQVRDYYGVPHDAGPVLVVLANVRRAKGHDVLISALARLEGAWPNIVCVCAGRDDSGGWIQRRVAESGLEKVILLPGFVDDPSQLYEIADLAVLPSLWEGMPSALVEALRAGVPSIASDVGGVSEVIHHEHQGLLVPAGDAAALAEAINSAIEDSPRRGRWGEAARSRYETAFRLEQMLDHTREVYDQVLAFPGS